MGPKTDSGHGYFLDARERKNRNQDPDCLPEEEGDTLCHSLLPEQLVRERVVGEPQFWMWKEPLRLVSPILLFSSGN